MLLGKKKDTDADIGKLWATEPETVVDYNSVLEYLVGLSGDDYTKICQVAAVYREADYQANKVLGLEVQPTTFISLPAEPENIPSDEPDFLEMPEKPKPKSRKIAVKE